jgi:glyoxylase-like metal-dependent hydrolase (beta-lactamase superfamily II)
MRVDQIDRDVFHLQGERFESGTLAVLDGDRALLVDGMASMADAARLREIVAVEWGKRVALLVSTHYFSDHLAAWNLFPEAPVIAHENAIATFWTEDFREREEMAHYRRPTVQLAGRLEISWGRHTVEVFENPGHTAGTLNVDLPNADLLHVGDTAVGRMAYVRYSAPEAIDRALARAQARGRSRVLRSHGPVAGPEVLASARGYLEGLRARVFEARRGHGRVRAIAIEDCLPPGPPATAFESFFHARNLASIEERGLYPEAA